MRKVLDGPVGEEILAAMEAQGFIGLRFYDSVTYVPVFSLGLPHLFLGKF